MPNRPLLLFPTPERAERGSLTSRPRQTHRPSHGRQVERVSPIFTQLQAAFDARQVELQQTAAGVEPEQVLVIETIGSIEHFANAVRRIGGLEWMGEIEIEEIAPDEDFYVEKSSTANELKLRVNKALDGRIQTLSTAAYSRVHAIKPLFKEQMQFHWQDSHSMVV